MIRKSIMIPNIEDYLKNLLNQYLDFTNRPLRIGAILLGGLGDALDFIAWLHGCRRMFPQATIVAYTGNETANTASLLEKFSPADIALPFKRHLKHFGIKTPIRGSSWQSLAEIERVKYDIFFDLRPYGCGIYRGDHFFCPDWFQPAYNNMLSVHTADLAAMGLSVVALRNLATGMDGNYSNIQFPIVPVDEGIGVNLTEPYITIHHGAQKDMKTKLWPREYWQILVRYLKENKYTVYQLGIKGEKLIEGAVNLLGKTTIFQTANILKHAIQHIDTEGGLVRLAACGNIQTKCTVLGGATPKELFSFPQNNNLWLNTCDPCYMRVGHWYQYCSRRVQGLEFDQICMKKLYPEKVIESIRKFL